MEKSASSSEVASFLGSSTAPLTWHDFLDRMRHPSASDFVKSIKSFIVSFSNNAPDLEKDSADVQDFLSNMEAAFRNHSLWAGSSEEELDSAGEGLEKYVMTKLFTRVFASLPEDEKADEQLSQKISLIQQFIQPENLDIKPAFQNETSWLLAQKELQKINMYKAPRDKLVCILNCCKTINNLLLNASIASNENPPGADEFLPVLIYVTIKANPLQLHSNLQYIQRYRRQSRLVSEAAYYFTNILSAVSFISNIDAKSLSMDETEFENNMESARALLSGLATDLDDTRNLRDQDGYIPRTESMKSNIQVNVKNKVDDSPSTKEYLPRAPAKNSEEDADVNHEFSMMKKPSTSDLEKKGATQFLTEDQISSIFQEYPYLYARMDDLTVNDVEDLLNSYKQLVLKYVCLSKGMGTAPDSLPLHVSQIQRNSNPETGKESEGIAEDIKKDKHEDVDRIQQSLDKDSLQQLENSEAKIPQDDSVVTLGEQ